MAWLTAFIALVSLAPAARATPARPPNIVFILADDLGFGDLGAYGQRRIQTPNLDRLAAQGMRLDRHYSGNAVCAPSRCVLLTGLHPGHAQVRDNRELSTEGQHPLARGTITLPSLLQAKGYVTGAFGKWGLGGPGTSGDPLNQGFDTFFGYNCQRAAHNHYPTSLWHNADRVALANPPFPAHQRLASDSAPLDPASYARFAGTEFAPDRIADQAVAFIREHRDRPFFLFVPTTLPHLALQIPEDGLRRYDGAFDEKPYLGGSSYLPHRTPRAAYAAMVSRIDDHVGRLLDTLDALDLARDTLVIFTSDNGPLYDQLGGTDTDFFQSAGAWRGRKGSLHEGGLRVPCLVRWPGHVPAGSTTSRLSGFEDWLPTLVEIAGASIPRRHRVDGVSMAPTLLGRSQPERAMLYREFPGYGGWQAAWKGNWKLVAKGLTPPRVGPPAPAAAPRLELYDLDSDPAESRDLARQHPSRVRQLQRILRQQHVRSAEFPLAAVDQGASTKLP